MTPTNLPTLFCLLNARLMRELAPKLGIAARTRWVPDAPALMRLFAAHESVAACLVEANDATPQVLAQVKERSPGTRRVVLADACDLKLVRSLLDSGLAHELIYLPLEEDSIAKALRLRTPTMPAGRGAGRSTSPSAARRAVESRE